jgi:hypothetical protein
MRGITRVIATPSEEVKRDRDRVREEIVDIHRFLSEWISGACPGDDTTYREGLLRRLSKNFILVTPLGRTFEGEGFTRMMRANHGSDPKLDIQIRQVEVRHREGSMRVATFEAWPDGGVEPTPPSRGRFCTVVMKDRGESFEFLHVHETWLPDGAARTRT